MNDIHELIKKRDTASTNIKLDELVNKKIKYYRKLNKRLNVNYIINTQPLEVNSKVATDLGLIFEELILNAHKYGFLNVETPTLKIEFVELKNHWEFKIADNGIGFNPHYSSGLEFV